MSAQVSQERRAMTLTTKDFQELRKVLNNGITPEDHIEQHEFIRALILREKRKQERYEKVKTHVIGWGVITAISSGGYAIWVLIKNFFMDHYKG